MGADPPARRTSRRVVLDRLDRDGAALARSLMARGWHVTTPPPQAGVAAPDGVTTTVDLLGAVGEADAVYVDCWTAETAAHVQAARQRGIETTSLADLAVAGSTVPVLGVTGTAGKTTTTHLIARLLRAEGLEVEIPGDGRAQNAWPGADTLTALERGTTPDLRVLELTSTHLAYMQSSPTVAVVTALWPDHVELHGGLDRYIAAKARILAAQAPGDRAVLPIGETRLVANPGVNVLRFDPAGVATGATVGWRGDRLVVRVDGDLVPVWEGERLASPLRSCLAAAVCACLATEHVPSSASIAMALADLPRWRGEVIGWLGDVEVLHDGMAATPAKARAALEDLADQSAVAIVGGTEESPAGPVHASAEEARLLDEACRTLERVAVTVVACGTAAARIAPLLGDWSGEFLVGPDLDWAVDTAVARTDGARVLLWSPMFPVALADRERFGDLVARSAAAQGRRWRAVGAPGAKDRS